MSEVVPELSRWNRPPANTDMVRIAAGTFRMGSDRHYAEEAPAHQVSVSGFWMDRTGQQENSARNEFFYFNDDGQLVAVRYQNWKSNFCEQRVEGTLQIWAEPFVCQRVPTLINLRMDPFERAPITSNTYNDWRIRHVFLLVPTQEIVARFVDTFKAFPPRQRPASFSVEQVMDLLAQPSGGEGVGTRALK